MREDIAVTKMLNTRKDGNIGPVSNEFEKIE